MMAIQNFSVFKAFKQSKVGFSLLKTLLLVALLIPTIASSAPNLYGGQGMFRTWSGQTVGNGKFSMGLGGLIINDPTQIRGQTLYHLNNAGDTTSTTQLQDLLELHANLFIVFGLSNYADLGVTFPIYQDRATYLVDPPNNDFSDANKFGFGDLKFWGKLQYPPYEHSKVFEMTLFAGASIPSGTGTSGFIPREAGYYISGAEPALNSNFSASEITGEVMMFWTLDIGEYDEEFPLRWHINYGMRTSMTRKYENTFLFRTGLELNPNPFLGLFVETSMDSRFTKFESSYEAANDPFYITPGIIVNTPQGFSITLAADFGLARRDETPLTSKVLRDADPLDNTYSTYEVNPTHEFAIGAIIAWTGYLTPQDSDQDGMVDDDDMCPNDPEDFDDFDDEDGCPEPDNDEDEILDHADKCPNKPEDKDGFEDEDGCPDLDNDEDGIPDVNDQCIDIPEDRNGHQDEDGCPDSGVDTDKDGVVDISDRCPNTPEDKDTFEDFDGCPEEDNDQDGFKDVDDKCPNVAEVVNGFEDEDGCPDVKPEVKKPTIAKKARIVLHGVNFASGSAKLTDDSSYKLDEVVAQLVDNPKVHLEIRGYTDNRGSKRINEKLSRKRAQSVVDYLVSRGIKAIRLRAKGYGPKSPVANNRTAEGRAKNRRIEMYRTK